MKPVYEAVAAKLGSQIRFGVVNIDEDAGMELAKKHDVFSEGIPNVKAFGTNGETVGAKVYASYQAPKQRELEKLVLAAFAKNAKGENGRIAKN